MKRLLSIRLFNFFDDGVRDGFEALPGDDLGRDVESLSGSLLDHLLDGEALSRKSLSQRSQGLVPAL